jgi:hypothetical protein
VSASNVIARAFALALLAAVGWVGGAALLAAVRRDTSTYSLDPDMSSDVVLGRIGVPHPTRVVNEMLRPWSKDNVLLVIAPAASPFSTPVYYELLTLGYPRRMPAIMCDSRPGASPREFFKELASSNIDGLIFFDIVPDRWVTGARQVAPKLYVVPYKGVPTWKSFCP